ncbi:MAG: hypothetical protein A2430_01875 [Candidatus Liptonbacteria bacterium RIFOXYC1_FULL_36_8]|uniref:RNHCP domain-containing protein n=3 Tax=Candidatus Liptoniibacteriota TaxID=1817909 RepID=A0A1G2CRE2_9BACT|nr:MAG: hypothetical protein A2390_02960 [Candidatus Liptonbacteria bacterium RIFOXYB1_FULL_36_10]OGZ04411.1 MAG: hypothetical protein A2430_01875 [Candidatus Liptonbacteria bacterium RIFOXYC1_FULL_36_8]OGZ04564.1 MAG: hypothetical protein A2604_01470 [Candidatus Liptonbacteria bacterium RIFOXYD1_FULL_36_11]
MAVSRKKFQRKIENFTCLNCGREVFGNGYTNHCPMCLWSRHIDINPGDREEKCGGMMEPVYVWKKGEKYILLHKCIKCGVERKNKISKDDNIGVLALINKQDFVL